MTIVNKCINIIKIYFFYSRIRIKLNGLKNIFLLCTFIFFMFLVLKRIRFFSVR